MTQLLGHVIADFETQLAAKTSVGDTTGTLTSATDDDGVALPAGRYFFTIDKGNSKKEHISCSLSGTALTNIKSVSRQGVETSGVLREHRVGANVIISDFAHIKKINDLFDGTTDLDSDTPLKYDGTATISDDAELTTKKYVDDSTVGISGDETVAGVKTFSSSPIVPTPTTDYQASTKKYVDDTAFAGAPDASETVKGIVEEATTAQTIAGDATGETGAKLFITPAKLVASLPTLVVQEKPYTIFSPITGSSLELVHTQYCDTTQFALASQNSTTIYYVNSTVSGGHQVRVFTSDWASAVLCLAQVTLGSYMYALLRDSSNNYRVYRYDKTNLSSGGTLMTISGQAFATTGGGNLSMTSNGTNFYLNYKGGNNASDRIISKYSLSGTTLTYVSDITCGASSNVANQLLQVDASDNIYGWYRSTDFGGDNKVRKYNSSGTLQYTSNAYGSSQIWRAVMSWDTTPYINYTVTSNPWWYLTRIFL